MNIDEQVNLFSASNFLGDLKGGASTPPVTPSSTPHSSVDLTPQDKINWNEVLMFLLQPYGVIANDDISFWKKSSNAFFSFFNFTANNQKYDSTNKSTSENPIFQKLFKILQYLKHSLKIMQNY